MTGFARGVSLGVLWLLHLAAPAHGQVIVTSYSYPVYYYPATVYYEPAVAYYAPVWPVYVAPAPVVCAPVVTVTPLPAGPVYAVPTAAPPSQTAAPRSQTAEPPLKAKAAPTVTESRTGAGPAKPALAMAGGADGDRVQVGFWNVTGRDLTLTIDGQTRALRRNRSLTLTVGRQFVWRVDQGAARTERVPEGSSTLEIVVRQ